MNRIKNLFQEKKENILSIYFTAGFPELNATVEILKSLEENGVDLVEIGMPFSDPLADGPVIQQSSTIALENGMSIPVLFDQLKDIRKEVNIPLVLMGYLNPIIQFGVENFLKECNTVGVDGLIIPDLPPDYYQANYKRLFKEYDLCNILLISPETSLERVRYIDSISQGFVYMVSSNSITGANKKLNAQQNYFDRINSLKLNNPRLIGFGIRDKSTFEMASRNASGAIIGTAFIQHLKEFGFGNESVKNFINNIKSE